MSLSRSPRLIKAGLVMIDPQSAQVRRVIALRIFLCSDQGRSAGCLRAWAVSSMK